MLDWLGGRDDDADTEGAHGDEHDEADGRMREHETCQSGSEKTADDCWAILSRDGEWCVVADILEEAEHVEDPDAESAPTETNASEDEVDRASHCVHRQNRVLGAPLDPDERDQAQHANDEEEVDMRSSPSVERAIVPGNVDKDETANTDERASPVEARG